MHNPLRKSYEARVLVVPLGESGEGLVDQLESVGVSGVRMLDVATRSEQVVTRAIGQAAWQPSVNISVAELVTESDMVVLVGSDLGAVPVEAVHEVCSASRESGGLVAAVLVRPHRWASPRGASSMVALRTESDMVVEVRGPKLLAALIDVLRGGARDVSSDTPPPADTMIGTR